ncbi:hypothetical protein [Legionella spiritensis]|uniref:Uncharacterized protein n=1 Tax=Legionella spiritensis TaxID=452 RepID=A0A0W0YXX7_LEGSP|nr:hypothetical protein [Legionella spiritensis]KTD61714.1 hypothetical protein Lspi_2344 [Legionella spiritensis]SNV38804.1 Uncharacterised protein [Legionella spiritensis]
MPDRIQPEDEIGPNNAGKMILRGCFMNVSQSWLENVSGQVGGVLSRYLDNRHGEATAITLNYGESVPQGREEKLYKPDIDFMATVVARLRHLEKKGAELQQASKEDIRDQVDEQVMVLQDEIMKYENQCDKIGVKPMFTGLPNVIIENVLSRKEVAHDESMQWETRDDVEFDLFAGLNVHDDNESEQGYQPPKLS